MVSDLGIAIFYNVSDAPKMISSGLVTSVYYDDASRIYFFISRPRYLMEDDFRFPAILDFYRKEKSYFIKIQGVAEILSDADEINNVKGKILKPVGEQSYSLVRLDINKIEYSDHSKQANGFFDHIKAVLSAIF